MISCEFCKIFKDTFFTDTYCKHSKNSLVLQDFVIMYFARFGFAKISTYKILVICTWLFAMLLKMIRGILSKQVYYWMQYSLWKLQLDLEVTSLHLEEIAKLQTSLRLKRIKCKLNYWDRTKTDIELNERSEIE